MKKIHFLYLCLPLFIFSCKKNGSSAPAVDATQFYLASVRAYSPGFLDLDSFTYNSNHLLSRYVQYSFDSTGGSPTGDSLIYNFSFSGNSKVPSSYAFTDPAGGITSPQGHQLFYDGQNRIVEDSNLNGSLYKTTYSYPGNNLASNVGFYFFGSVYRKDTLIFSNGNLSSERIYYPNSAGTGDSLAGTYNFNYSSYGNPAYHPEIAGTIGHLLFNLSYDGTQNYGDFNSKDFVKSLSVIQPGVPGIPISYNLTLDSKGRISQVTTSIYPPSQYRIVFTYY